MRIINLLLIEKIKEINLAILNRLDTSAKIAEVGDFFMPCSGESDVSVDNISTLWALLIDIFFIDDKNRENTIEVMFYISNYCSKYHIFLNKKSLKKWKLEHKNISITCNDYIEEILL